MTLSKIVLKFNSRNNSLLNAIFIFVFPLYRCEVKSGILRLKCTNITHKENDFINVIESFSWVSFLKVSSSLNIVHKRRDLEGAYFKVWVKKIFLRKEQVDFFLWGTYFVKRRLQSCLIRNDFSLHVRKHWFHIYVSFIYFCKFNISQIFQFYSIFPFKAISHIQSSI